MTASARSATSMAQLIKHPLTSLRRELSKRRLRRGNYSIVLTAATRNSEAEFWQQSLLGRYLKAKPPAKHVLLNIAFDNTRGLPAIYNEALKKHPDADLHLFVHDDVWFAQEDPFDQLAQAAARFDITGIAGNTRRSNRQPAWLFKGIYDNQFLLDRGYLSGAVLTGDENNATKTTYGPTPAPCELIDGVLISVLTSTAKCVNLHFDERFTFDFYDLDFCRAAKEKGLSIGTWPLDIVHASPGVFGKPTWVQALNTYLAKWRS